MRFPLQLQLASRGSSDAGALWHVQPACLRRHEEPSQRACERKYVRRTRSAVEHGTWPRWTTTPMRAPSSRIRPHGRSATADACAAEAPAWPTARARMSIGEAGETVV